jgi:hypothetical protein
MSAKMILTMLFFASLCVVVILAFRALPQRMNGDTAERREEILVAATPCRSAHCYVPRM